MKPFAHILSVFVALFFLNGCLAAVDQQVLDAAIAEIERRVLERQQAPPEPVQVPSTVPDVDPVPTPAPPVVPDPDPRPAEITTEQIRYDKRTNGNRPTWRSDKPLRDFPATFTVRVPGCGTWQVKNNGIRHDDQAHGLLVKQSDVYRGAAFLVRASCSGTQLFVEY